MYRLYQERQRFEGPLSIFFSSRKTFYQGKMVKETGSRGSHSTRYRQELPIRDNRAPYSSRRYKAAGAESIYTGSTDLKNASRASTLYRAAGSGRNPNSLAQTFPLLHFLKKNCSPRSFLLENREFLLPREY